MREYSIPPLVRIPDSASLADVVFRRAQAEPQRVVLRRRGDDGRWRDVSAAQFAAEVTALAKMIIAAGIGPGDRIALMSRTRYEWTLADYAIWSAGAVCVPVYETSSARQVGWILSDSGARAIFTETPEHARLVEGIRGELPGLGPVWPLTGPDALTAGSAGGSAGSAQVSDETLEQRRGARGAADLATIIYTSGTTGRPKGCELTHRNLLAGVRNAVDGVLPQLFELPGSSTLLFLPLAHSFARIIEIACLEAGAVLGHWPDAGTVAEGLPEFRPSFLLAVPRVFEKVYTRAQQQAAASKAKAALFAAAADTAIAWSKAMDAPAGGPVAGRAGAAALRARHALFDRLVFSRLRAALGGNVDYAISGGAPLGERLGHFFRGAGLEVLEGYGLTETSAAALVNKPARNKIGTVGLPLPGVSIKIADDGEIMLRGDIVFPGYWRNEKATAEALDPAGWLRTGDIGALDDEGFLRVTGRKKELIVTAGGKNVAPAVLEDQIRAHPLVSQCMVVGDGRAFIGCLITLDPEALDFWKQQHGKPADATAAGLAEDPDLRAELQAAIDEANQSVSRAESIRKFRVLASDFTEGTGHLTPSLKVKRHEVASDYAADIEALYGK